jgi:hypothetical protein
MLCCSMLLVPAMAMGIAQQEQDPATATDPAVQQNQLQQDQTLRQPDPAMEAEGGDVTGVIVEVRDDRFSVRKDDESVVWFMITPDHKTQWSNELVAGNRVRVSSSAGDMPDMRNAISVSIDDSMDTADADADLDVDADVDADLDTDTDTATATAEVDVDSEFDTDTATAEAEVAEADAKLEDDAAEFDTTAEFDSDSDELPRTASPLPAIGSLGLLALLGAAVVAIARRF